MTKKFKIAGMLVSALVLAGCVGTPEQFATAPVEVETSKGIVVCQLYTPEIVLWDRSIGRPDSMSSYEADGICRERGASILENRNG